MFKLLRHTGLRGSILPPAAAAADIGSSKGGDLAKGSRFASVLDGFGYSTVIVSFARVLDYAEPASFDLSSFLIIVMPLAFGKAAREHVVEVLSSGARVEIGREVESRGRRRER